MRRSLIVAFAVVATLLAVSAMPAAAANVAVVSEHETFGAGNQGEPSPQTLTNMTVSGSGTSAVVTNTDTKATASTDVSLGNTYDDTYDTGVQITPSRPIDQIMVETALVASNYQEATRVLVKSGDGSTVLGTGSISSRTGTVTGLNLQPGTQYRIVVDNAGSNYYFKQYNNDGNYPSSSLLSVDSGIAAGSASSTFVYSVQDITASSPDAGTYVSATHDASNVTEGFTDLSTISGGSATVEWEYNNGNGWQTATSNTYTTGGNKSVSLSASADQWRVRVSTSRSDASHNTVLEREGVLAGTEAPSLSNPDPTGNISSYDGDISIDVSDPDFGEAHGDSVTVSVEDSNGDQIGSDTVTSNQTVTIDYVAKANDNNLTWSASDSYGSAATTDQDFEAPTFLAVRNESAPGQIINTQSNVTATFFAEGSETVVQKTSTNGRFDFTGLPAATQYTVAVDADGYEPRRVVIDSLFEQQNVYLLPNNAQSATVEFVLDDQTGNFDAESTTLFVEIPLTRNSSTEYRVATADQFGAAARLRNTLRDDTRYRIRVRNTDGDERVLGSYTVSGADTVTLEIGQLRFAVQDSPDTYNVSASTVENSNETVEAVKFNYRDPTDSTTRINVSVETLNGTVVGQDTGTATYGSYSFRQNVSNATARNNTFVVVYNLTRNGETISGQLRPGLNRYPPGVPLDDGLKQLFSVGFLIMVGGLFSATNARVGAVVTPLFATGLWYVEWLPPGTSILAIALALGVGVLVNYGDRR